MKINLAPGKYVVAVSGGVDSMVLLHLLVQQSQSLVPSPKSSVRKESARSYGLKAKDSSSLELVVAHYDHGIRPDSAKDEALVRKMAKQYGLLYESGHGHLGSGVSEDKARRARYNFLSATQRKHGAKAIITAHHQDDLIETAFINLLRGTGRRGLSSMSSNLKVMRPLLSMSKKQILTYAKAHAIVWSEDQTNNDEAYLRNYVRKALAKNLTKKNRTKLVTNLDKVAKSNLIIDNIIATISQQLLKHNQLARAQFINLPYEVASEVLIYWLRTNNYRQFDRPTLKRLNLAVKTAKPGTLLVLNNDMKLEFSDLSVALTTPV